MNFTMALPRRPPRLWSAGCRGTLPNVLIAAHHRRALSASPERRAIGIGLLGCGTVGSAVAALLSRPSNLARRLPADTPLRIVLAARRNPAPLVSLPHVEVISDPIAVARDPEVDVVVEVMGSPREAGRAVEEALELGKPVVTANKSLLASRPDLFDLARRKGVPLLFEAAVAGGIPIVSFLRTHLACSDVSAITAVLNGSTNFIFEAVNAGSPIDKAMDEARKLGFLEADPREDVEGIDAGNKIRLLHRLAFPDSKSAFSATGILGLPAPPEGRKWRLLCRATEREATVAPALVGPESPFWALPGATNAVLIETDVGNYFLSGPGAGGMPTAGSVVGDVVRCVDFLAAKRRPGKWLDNWPSA
ncbi:homoserine dehydrogenase [Hyaloraphidium curvatum]|nr:homoserine dehydrogenase [Hyaloraphidium curvatum]